MKYILILSLIITSCKPGKKTPLEGKWEFEKNEIFPGVQLNALQDSLIMIVLKEQQKGLTLTFKGSSFKGFILKNGVEEAMGNQPFELTADQRSLVLINNGVVNDTFPVIFLSDTILKLNMFNSKEGYLVFRKKK